MTLGSFIQEIFVFFVINHFEKHQFYTPVDAMAQPIATSSITLGDLFQRVALGVHRELEQCRNSMRSMDPELRTKYLRTFVGRTLKKLAQLYAICTWLNNPNVGQFFNSLNDLKRQVVMLETQLCITQDQLFYKHAELFPMRSRPMEVEAAMDILASGTYSHLPSVIFSCGRMPKPGNLINKQLLIKDMEVFIRSKLFLYDQLPRGVTHSSISNGVLTFGMRGVYECMVTLTQLVENAAWIVLDSNICAASNPSEEFTGGYDVDLLNVQLGAILVEKCKAAIPVFAPTSTPETDEQSQSARNEKMDCMLVDSSPELVHAASAETGHIASPAVATFTLTHIHNICKYVGISAAHRLLYSQAFETARSLWRGCMDVTFYEDIDCFQLRVGVWKSAFNGSWQVQLRLSQDRTAIKKLLTDTSSTSSTSSPISLYPELFLVSTFVAQDREHVTLHRITKGANKNENDCSDDAGISCDVEHGAAFTPFLYSCLHVLARCKIKYLHSRILRTACTGPNSIALKTVELIKTDTSITITDQEGKKLIVNIDARSGEYVLRVCGVNAVTSNKLKLSANGDNPVAAVPTSREEAVFMKEINSVEIQQDLIRLLSDPLEQGQAAEAGTDSLLYPGLTIFDSPAYDMMLSGAQDGIGALIRPLVSLESFLMKVFA